MALSYSEEVRELQQMAAGDKTEIRIAEGYYESTYRLTTIGLSAPPEMRALSHAVGWPRMYVDSLEERLDVEGFRLAGSSQTIDILWDWWQANNMDEESGLAHLDAFIYGRSYATVGRPGPLDPPGVPVIRIESPKVMYAEVDPRTRQVVRAVRIYEYETPGNVADTKPLNSKATLYLPNETVPLREEKGKWVLDGKPDEHNFGFVPVVPIINRSRVGDRHGQSEITEELRSFTDAASRTVMNMQAATELMATPQRYMFGVDSSDLAPGGTKAELYDAYMARIIAVSEPEGKAGQFSAAELRNYTEALQEMAKHVASYTGLPPQYLSFSSENPASAEAIKSSESRLVKKSERKARQFGGAWEQVMRLAIRVMGVSNLNGIDRLETVWRDPSTPTYAAKADGVMKLFNGGNGVIPKEYARIDMGYTDEQRRDMEMWDRKEPKTIDNLLARGDEGDQ